VSVLPLPPDARPQPVDLLLTTGQPKNALVEEVDPDAGLVGQLGGPVPVVLSARDTDLEQRILGWRVELGCQQTRRGPPRLTRPIVRVEHGHRLAGSGNFARAGRPDDAPANDYNVAGISHLAIL
jgi:hypothetical protein